MLSSSSGTFFVLFVAVITTIFYYSSSVFLISAAPVSGTWHVPEVAPSPSVYSALACLPATDDATIQTADGSYGGYSGTSTAKTAPKLYGGTISNGESVRSAWSYFKNQDQWFPEDNFLPARRSGQAIVFDSLATASGNQSNTIYMFGGHTAGGTLTDNTVFRSVRGAPWTPVLTRARTRRDPPPLTRFGYWLGSMADSTKDADATTSSALFVWGGLTSGGVSSSVYWFAFDEVSEKGLRWGEAFQSKTNDDPAARYDTCCQMIQDGTTNNRAICFGGAGLESDFNDIWIADSTSCNQNTVDTTGKSWAACLTFSKEHDGHSTGADDAPPSNRSASACAYVKNTGEEALYVFGGYDSNSGKAIDDNNLYRYDLNTKKWAKTAQKTSSEVGDEHSALTPRYGAAMATCANATARTLYVYGGITKDGEYKSETFELELGTNTKTFPAHDATLQFSDVDNSEANRPIGRSEHAAALSQGEVYIMFGTDRLGASALKDVWRFNVSTELWTKVDIVPDEETMTEAEIPRYGATAIEFRSSIMIFGGQNALGTPLNDLLVMQPSIGEIRRINPSGSDAPEPRAYNVMVRISDTVVIGTGWSAANGFFDDWWKFDSVAQAWQEMTIVGDSIGSRLAMASIEQYNNTHTIVGLGIGSRVFIDFYWLSFENGTHIRSVKMNVDYSAIDSGERGVIRAYTSLSGSGNHLVVCGGSISETDPAPISTNCYQAFVDSDANSMTITTFPSPYLGAVYGTATMVENKLVLFGGQQTSPTSFRDIFIDAPQIFKFNSLCKETDTNDDSCIKCSKGFKNTGTSSPRCEVAPRGKYISDGLGSFIDCPAGKFSNAIGAFSDDACIPCRAGTFNNQTGAVNCTPCESGKVCLAGTAQQVDANSLQGQYLRSVILSSGKLSEENPPPLGPYPIPWFPILFVGLTAIILTSVLAVVLGVSNWVWNKRREYYVPETTHAVLKAIYVEFGRSVRGMNEQEFISATFSQNFPEHDGSLLDMQQLFKELNVNGIGALTFKEFIEAFVLMISRGHMKPLDGSKRKQSGKEFEHWGTPLIGKWDVRNFDNFTDDHMTASVGEKILSQQIAYSGALTLAFYVAVIILILAIVINFLYNNTTETKASVPRAVIQSSFGSLFQVTSDLSASVTILGPIRTLNGISTLEDACVKSDGSCRSASVSYTNVLVNSAGAYVEPLRCDYDNRTGCTVTWGCKLCSITEGSTGTLEFRIAPQVAANSIDVTVSTSTGIRNPIMDFSGKLSMVGGPNQRSRVTSRAAPSESDEVITGFPSSELFFGLTPTYYDADEVENAIDASYPTYRDTGYHVRQLEIPQTGNSVPSELFASYYDTPVTVSMKVDETPLLVRRKFTQDVIQLIVALLGAIAGLSGAVLLAVQTLDTKLGVNENADSLKHDELENEDEVAGLNDMYTSGIESLMTTEEFAIVRPIVERGVAPIKASAFLEILRRRRQSGGKGSSVRLAGRQQTNMKNLQAGLLTVNNAQSMSPNSTVGNAKVDVPPTTTTTTAAPEVSEAEKKEQQKQLEQELSEEGAYGDLLNS